MVDELKKELIKLNEDRIYIENRIERTYNRIKKLFKKIRKIGLNDEIGDKLYDKLYNAPNEHYFQRILDEWHNIYIFKTEMGLIKIIQKTIEEELEKMIQEKELK